MSAAQDPFYIVKDEIQDSVEKLQVTYRRWEQILLATEEKVHLTKELMAGCDNIEWQLDELDKAISVAAREPTRFSINEIELENRKRWTGSTRNHIESLKKGVKDATDCSIQKPSTRVNPNSMRQELLRVPNNWPSGYPGQANVSGPDDFITSETDKQLLLMREQDQELDELSLSVERLGSVGLTIHDELRGQERILAELDQDMDQTSNRLEFVQKKVALVMKKAGAMGQIMMIVFLIILFIVLVLLVFFT